MSEFRLCYVDRQWAWFTSQPITEQWGDDWNDAPYEHNAGDPYYWREGDKKPQYELVKLAYECDLQTPAQLAWSGNSAYSVEMINAGSAAWLAPDRWMQGEPIPAGVTIDEFRQLIWNAGGQVYERVPAPDAGQQEA